MDNATRRQLLMRHRQSEYPGSILDVFKAYDMGIDLLGQFEQQNNIQVAQTPQQQQQGLRPAHQAGDISQSMIFPNVPPNTPFNTVGMKSPINIEKYDEQGHLVKSYENVPPGVQNLPTGPQRGTVIETPANMQAGGDYNMARAQELGYKPDATGHYPSVDHETGMLLKSKEHPTVKLEFMSQMLSPERKMIANPTGYFGENQLQYVPRKMQSGGVQDNTRVSMPELQDQEAFNPYSDLRLPPSGRVEYSGANVEDLLGVGSLLKAPLKSAAKNTYKINPFARKSIPVDESTWVRGVGKEGLDDLRSSGLVRSKNDGAYPQPYFGHSDGIKKVISSYGGGKDGVVLTLKGAPMKGVGAFPTGNPFIQTPKELIKLGDPRLKAYSATPHWLRGYKQIKQTGGIKFQDTMDFIDREYGPDQFGDTLTLSAMDLISEHRQGILDAGSVRDTIAYHETGSRQRMQPNAVQIVKDKDSTSTTYGQLVPGVGRGKYMYDKPSTLTAANRVDSLSSYMGLETPEFIRGLQRSEGTSRADTLTGTQQDMLYMGDLIEGPAPGKDYGAGEATLEDVWYKGHNRRTDEKNARLEFRESMRGIKQDNLRNYYFAPPKPNFFERQKQRHGGPMRKYFRLRK